MNLARLAASVLIASGALCVVASGPSWRAAAEETAGLSEQQRDYQTLKEMLHKRNPDLADRIDRKLREIDASDASEEQKERQKERYLDKRKESAFEAANAAEQLGGDVTRAVQVMHIIDNMLLNQREAMVRKGLAPSGQADAAFDPGEMRHGLDQEFRTTARRLEEERRRAEQSPATNGDHSSLPLVPGWSLVSGGAYGHRDVAAARFLATEFGPGTLKLGVVAADRDLEVTGWDVALRYAGEFSGFRLLAEPYARVLNGEDADVIGSFDPAGANLGLPGTGDPTQPFPAGVLFPSAGGLNRVEDLVSAHEYESWEAGGRVGFVYPVWPNAVIVPLFGVGWTQINEDSWFNGAIPGFGVDFGYATAVETNRFSTELGLRYVCNPHPMLTFWAQPSVSLHFLDVSGSDRFMLHGPVSTDQRVPLHEDDTRFGAAFEAGLGFRPEGLPLGIEVSGKVAHAPGAVEVFRSGEKGEQSAVDIDNETMFIGTIRATFTF